MIWLGITIIAIVGISGTAILIREAIQGNLKPVDVILATSLILFVAIAGYMLSSLAGVS